MQTQHIVTEAQVLKALGDLAETWGKAPEMKHHMVGARTLAVHLLMNAPVRLPEHCERLVDSAIAEGKKRCQ